MDVTIMAPLCQYCHCNGVTTMALPYLYHHHNGRHRDVTSVPTLSLQWMSPRWQRRTSTTTTMGVTAMSPLCQRCHHAGCHHDVTAVPPLPPSLSRCRPDVVTVPRSALPVPLTAGTSLCTEPAPHSWGGDPQIRPPSHPHPPPPPGGAPPSRGPIALQQRGGGGRGGGGRTGGLGEGRRGEGGAASVCI